MRFSNNSFGLNVLYNHDRINKQKQESEGMPGTIRTNQILPMNVDEERDFQFENKHECDKRLVEAKTYTVKKEAIADELYPRKKYRFVASVKLPPPTNTNNWLTKWLLSLVQGSVNILVGFATCTEGELQMVSG